MRADSQNLRGNPQDLRALRSNHPPCNFNNYRLPRSHSLARNDEILDSSLRLRSAQYDKKGLDSAIFARVAESALKLKQTIEVMAVWLLYL